MARWLDQWARRAAGESRPEPAEPSRPTPEFDRRQMLKRGAVVGAALWTAPVLQTVLAPAASASTIGGVGSACSSNGQCTTGICAGGVCQAAAMYDACTSSADCAFLGADCIGPSYTGGTICAKAWPGSGTFCTSNAGCTSNNCQGTTPTKTCRTHTAGTTATSSCRINQDCSSGACVGGFCAKVAAGGGTCASNVDCTSGSCNTTTKLCNKRSFGGTCGSNPDCYTNNCVSAKCAKATAGGTCNTNTDCTSNKCTSGVCVAGRTYNQTCSVDGDCINGHCVSGLCGKYSAGVACTANSQCQSGTCSASVCTKGGTGKPCWNGGDCTSGTCNSGFCA